MDRVMFCLKPFDVNDFRHKFETDEIFNVSQQPFLCKNLKLHFPTKLKPCIFNISLHRALLTLVVVNQIVDNNSLRIATSLLHSNKIISPIS